MVFVTLVDGPQNKHKEGDGFMFSEGILYICDKDGKSIAAYLPAHVVKVQKG